MKQYRRQPVAQTLDPHQRQINTEFDSQLAEISSAVRKLGEGFVPEGGVTVIPGAGVTDHGDLTGLGDDDHAQYLLLAGRNGGQVVFGNNTDPGSVTHPADVALDLLGNSTTWTTWMRLYEWDGGASQRWWGVGAGSNPVAAGDNPALAVDAQGYTGLGVLTPPFDSRLTVRGNIMLAGSDLIGGYAEFLKMTSTATSFAPVLEVQSPSGSRPLMIKNSGGTGLGGFSMSGSLISSDLLRITTGTSMLLDGMNGAGSDWSSKQGTNLALDFLEVDLTGSFPDDTFRVSDNADTTKKFALECSGITTATTRTGTVQDESGTIPLAVGPVNLTGQTGNIGTTTAYTTTHDGMYLIEVYVKTTTAGAGGDLISAVTIGWNDGTAQTKNALETNHDLAVNNTYSAPRTFAVWAASGTTITYATTCTITGAPAYALRVRVLSSG